MTTVPYHQSLLLSQERILIPNQVKRFDEIKKGTVYLEINREFGGQRRLLVLGAPFSKNHSDHRWYVNVLDVDDGHVYDISLADRSVIPYSTSEGHKWNNCNYLLHLKEQPQLGVILIVDGKEVPIPLSAQEILSALSK